VIGAGAAGLMAAIAAAGGPAPVLLLERTADGGRKILISGGGRCNVLPEVIEADRFVTDSPPHLMRGMLRSWPLSQMVRFFEEDAGIPLALEAESGKLFPRSNRARDVRDALVMLARRRGVRLQFDTRVEGVVPVPSGWTVTTTTGAMAAGYVIIATGGLSVPTTGSDGTGFSIARATGHSLHEPYPALTPLTHRDPASPLDPERLAGVSLRVRIRARARHGAVEATGGFLFTHKGYSGPAVLDISHVCVRSEDGEPARVRVAWSPTPADEWDARLQSGDRQVATLLSQEMPERLAHALLAHSDVPRDRRTSALTRSERLAIVANVTSCELRWSGHEGYKKAEVTGGGVALDEVDPRTLESRRSPRLYFCGEVLDAFGPIGGHNFAWAWATGRTAGLSASRAAIT
jgi:predicted Rossmann fold flavoprotein